MRVDRRDHRGDLSEALCCLAPSSVADGEARIADLRRAVPGGWRERRSSETDLPARTSTWRSAGRSVSDTR